MNRSIYPVHRCHRLSNLPIISVRPTPVSINCTTAASTVAPFSLASSENYVQINKLKSYSFTNLFTCSLTYSHSIHLSTFLHTYKLTYLFTYLA